MPIYDQSYKRWDGQLYPRGTRWLVIAQDSLRRSFKGKAIKACLLLGLIPFLIWVARLYISVNFDALTAEGSLLKVLVPARAELTDIGPAFYHDFLQLELVLVFFVILISGCSLIADDRRANALPLYLSKALTRVDYLFGKGAGVAVPIALLTLIPGVLLYILHALFQNDWLLLFQDARNLLAIVLQSMLVIVSGTVVILAISSCTKQGRYAAFGFIGLIVGGNILQLILRESLEYTRLRSTLGSPKVQFLSFYHDCRRMAVAIFDVESSGRSYHSLTEGFDWAWALLGIGLFVGVSLWILHRRIRGMDIVK